MAFLVNFLLENLMKDTRKDMFVLEGSVLVSLQRPFNFLLVLLQLLGGLVCWC